MRDRKLRISVIGAGKDCPKEIYDIAYKMGRLLARNGFVVVCGGLSGVMEAVAKGASIEGGESIGILPGRDIESANKYITHPIATGLGEMRNLLVVLNGELSVAIGGGYGTLSEIALSFKIGKKVIAIKSWKDIPGVIYTSSPEEAINTILKLVRMEHE